MNGACSISAIPESGKVAVDFLRGATLPSHGTRASRESKYSDEVRERVVALYTAGTKLTEIERQLNLPRATIYKILEQSQVAPSRMQMKTRIERGDPVATVEWAFNKLLEQERALTEKDAIIEAKDREIARLKKRLGLKV